ncbi:MAG TPA: protein-glutamate O-methyltransferase CheR [Isosphaeraceae bacterium]|nr:protein-glutamate O-methyltransferase CheR [Isosphaeraceae bacterium]
MPSSLRPDDYQFLARLLAQNLGHDLGAGKEYLLESRLRPVVLKAGLPDLAALVNRLRGRTDPQLRDTVLDALSTGETSFFRGSSAFEALRRQILPALIEARSRVRRLSLWSAACSTGQEPYSLAMLLIDEFPQVQDWNLTILATDASSIALQRAEEGRYTRSEIRRGLSEERLMRHFEPLGDRWSVRETVRRSVRFRRLNLLDPFGFRAEEHDLILLRNVLLYFDTARKAALFARLRSVIAPDGYLLLGESETILGLTDAFALPSTDQPYYRPV